MVSSRHVEIRCQPQHCLVLDVGSKNGTLLNDRRLTSRKEYPLQRGDRLSIGDFTIHFDVLVPTSPRSGEPESSGSGAQVGATKKGSEVVYGLKRLYAELSGREPSDRMEMLRNGLREALKGAGPEEAEQILIDVETEFGLPGQCSPPIGPQVAMSPLRSSGNSASLPSSTPDTPYEPCLALAQQYCKDLTPPLSPEFATQLMERMARVFAVTVKSLAQAMEGRRRFAREFEVEATKIFAWTPNRIKLAEDADEIATYLLDPRKSQIDAAVKDLEGAFQDLALHQLGLMAGLKACLRGLLAELDPASIEKSAKEGSGRLKRGGAPWDRFKEKHRQLSEEEVNVFERILAPHFATGYLSVQKVKKH
jgi:type VI secretion system protein ImpI